MGKKFSDYLKQGKDTLQHMADEAESAAKRMLEPPQNKAPLRREYPLPRGGGAGPIRPVDAVRPTYRSAMDTRRPDRSPPVKPGKASESTAAAHSEHEVKPAYKDTTGTYKSKPGQHASKSWLQEVNKPHPVPAVESRANHHPQVAKEGAKAAHPETQVKPAAPSKPLEAGHHPEVKGQAPVHSEVKQPASTHHEVKAGKPTAPDMPDPKRYLEELYKKMAPQQLQDHIKDLRKAITERADPHAVEQLEEAVKVRDAKAKPQEVHKPALPEKPAPAPAERHPAVTKFEESSANLERAGYKSGVQRPATPAESSPLPEAPKGNWRVGTVVVGGLSGLGMITGTVQAYQGVRKMLQGHVAEGASDTLAGTGNATSGGASLAHMWKPSSVLGTVAMKAGGFANVVSGGYNLAEGIKNRDAEKAFDGGVYSVSGALMIGSKAAGPYAAFGSTVYGVTRFGMGVKFGGRSGDERVTGLMDGQMNAAANENLAKIQADNLKLYEQHKDGTSAKDLTKAVIGLREQIEKARKDSADAEEVQRMQEELKELIKRRGDAAKWEQMG